MNIYKDETTDYTWRFYQNGNKTHWQQVYPDGIVGKESDIGFEDPDQCIADARKHGMNCRPNLQIHEMKK